MAYDVISHFYSCLNEPLRTRIPELTKIIEQSVHNKDLNTIFSELIINIFGWPTFNGGWGLRNMSSERDRYEYELVHGFLHPQGPMFMLCYKLLGDPQMTFNLSMHLLPAELKLSFETGRYAQFYADLFKYDPRVMNAPSLELNAFDYYIFYFALNLLHSGTNSRYTADILYFNLAIEYVLYFLPTDPNVAVLPPLPHFTGKMPVVAPLQTANRSLAPSLLLKPSLSDLNNQHAQSENRNEVWRSETVLQVFTDVWMSVLNVKTNNVEMYRRYPDTTTCAERVRLCRALVKQVHRYASSSVADPGARGAALRRYSRQLICTRGYRCVKYLVEVWPLDASFKVVLELWLSLIQPWRYEANAQDAHSQRMGDMDDERCLSDAMANYTKFIAENFPTYTYILQIMLSRFLRLDLTVAKNTIMLFRLGKVFSQSHLINVVRELEKYVTTNNDGYVNNNNPYDNNYSIYGRWGAVAKQSISELNMNPNFLYTPLWTDQNKPMMLEFFKRIVAAEQDAVANCEKLTKSIELKSKSWWAMLMGAYADDERMLNEIKDVPKYLNSSIQYFSLIFGISNTIPQDMSLDDNTSSMDQTFNTSDLQHSITQKLRNRSVSVHYMGDPDLMPIMSNENTILVRMFYQISSKINELYANDFANLWNDNGFWGLVAREILQAPCTIQTYGANTTNYNSLANQELPARLSLRRLGRHSFLLWMTLGYLFSKLFGFTLFTFLLTVFLLWTFTILMKVTAKAIGIVKCTD